jgi:hypothetical protein
MRLEKLRPTVLRMTVHSYELATIIAALRWMVDKEPQDVPAESLQMVNNLLADYERELSHLNDPAKTPPARPDPSAGQRPTGDSPSA